MAILHSVLREISIRRARRRQVAVYTAGWSFVAAVLVILTCLLAWGVNALELGDWVVSSVVFVFGLMAIAHVMVLVVFFTGCVVEEYDRHCSAREH